MATYFSNIKDRVLKIPDFKGISKESFFEDLNVSYGNFKGKAKEKSLSSDTLATIVAKYPEINPVWLLTGQGGMLLGDNKGSIVAEPAITINREKERIPLVSHEAAAGFGSANFCISEDDVLGYYVVPDFKKVDFMIALRGSSMCPSYNAGDIVACLIIKESQFIQWNKIYIIATAYQGLICKRLNPSEKEGHLLAVSDNKDYPPFDIPLSEIKGIALVIGAIRIE
ncbi:MAG: hypothetical protein M9892_12170 [Bacteroidetes bacterium]|nr:hypothetical protein [Bacteroidota bacterium]